VSPQPGKFCVACGNQIHVKAEICPRCGVRQPAIGGMGSAFWSDGRKDSGTSEQQQGASQYAPPQPTKFCVTCGNHIHVKAEICPRCGVRQPGTGGLGGAFSSEGRKDKIVAALLAFFLGMFGVHRFYLGDTKNGTIMLVGSLVSWLLLVVGIGLLGLMVFGVWGFVDFVRYLVMSDADFAAAYNQ
jgi:TM2 domain-containing membrane protein YozV/RNA polymerase subunit RPABC4/transcription elongation factor Spt4